TMDKQTDLSVFDSFLCHILLQIGSSTKNLGKDRHNYPTIQEKTRNKTGIVSRVIMFVLLWLFNSEVSLFSIFFRTFTVN
ncbi:hypothetical protein, partial [Erwinia amylovora]|uniref:hypothetical protein n=1 Tax=Erwinia amylovora TaxID=552 RepID=UPI003D6E75A6